MKIVVCDDEIPAGQQVCQLVNEILGEASCRLYTNERQLLAELDENPDTDAVILDIEWNGEEKGIGIAQKVSRMYPDTSIIFLTGYTEKYVQQIFLTPANLSGFLMKPVDKELLRNNLKKIHEKSKQGRTRKFIVRSKGETAVLLFDDILYLESAAHKVCVHTKRGNYFSYGKLEELLKEFPENFIQCHKSYVVNLEEVRCIGPGGHAFIMTNDKTIPISKSRYHSTKDYFFEYTKTKAFSALKE